MLILACGAAAVGSEVLDQSASHLEADAELARLLRAMALLKGSMIAAALLGLLWRFGWPVSFGLGFVYVAGAALAAGAAVLLWNLAYVATAAVLFHVGAGAMIVGALFDRSGLGSLTGRRS